MLIVGSPTSPYTRKVRIVALERGVPFEFIVATPASDARVAELNPLGKVPVLMRDDGSTLIDSPLIAAWLDTRGTGEALIPELESEREAVVQWEAVADGALDAAVLIRAEQQRPVAQRSASWTERQRGKIDAALAWMQARIEGRSHCAVERFSLADIALGCVIDYLEFRLPEGHWRGRYRGLDRLYAELAQRASFHATLPHE
jgi:glutathione S-transferase